MDIKAVYYKKWKNMEIIKIKALICILMDELIKTTPMLPFTLTFLTSIESLKKLNIRINLNINHIRFINR